MSPSRYVRISAAISARVGSRSESASSLNCASSACIDVVLLLCAAEDALDDCPSVVAEGRGNLRAQRYDRFAVAGSKHRTATFFRGVQPIDALPYLSCRLLLGAVHV